MTPKISVVIPAYNRGPLIAQTLQSVADQTCADWECLVIDDGSTDNTPEVVKAWARRDPRFRYIRQDNASASAARNRGLAEARAAYITFLDSDDMFRPDKLQWQSQELDQDEQLLLVYGDTYQFVEETGAGSVYLSQITDKPTGDAFDALLTCSSIYSPMIRASALRDAGGFDTSLASAEDWDAWLTLARRGRILYRPRIALDYRVHPGNKSGNTLRNLQCARQVARKHTRHLPPLRRARQRARIWLHFRKLYRQKLMFEATSLTRARDWESARQRWRMLIRINPVLLRNATVLSHGLWALLPCRRPPFWLRARTKDKPLPQEKPA